MTMPKARIASPGTQGATRSLGLPVGQHADWRWPRKDGGCLHVRDMGDHYEAHLDRVDPGRDMLGHLRADEPVTWTLLLGATGWLLGAFQGAPWKGAGVGIALAIGTHMLARKR